MLTSATKTEQNPTSKTEVKPLTPEQLNELVSLVILNDGDKAARSLATLINTTASISDGGTRTDFTVDVIECVYRHTTDYSKAVTELAQIDKREQ